MDILNSFPSVIELDVQWGDMDALGHVNNTVPVRWYESSRIRFMESTGMAQMLEQHKLGPILAAVNCSYRKQLFYPDRVHIGCRANRIGGSSITLSHVVVSETQEALAAEGESVVVAFDFEKQRPSRIPDEIRAALKALQPELGK